jgi:hypothetical protein
VFLNIRKTPTCDFLGNSRALLDEMLNVAILERTKMGKKVNAFS